MIEVLYDALRKAGIPLPPEEVHPGKYVRWGRKKEYYAFCLRDGSGYCFGNFKEGDSQTVFPDSKEPLTKKQTAARKKALAEANAILDAEIQKNNEQVSSDCSKYRSQMVFCTGHPYLTKKKVKSHGLKTYKDKLVIPLFDALGKLWSFQYISDDGTKVFKRGGRKKGLFFPIGFKINDTPTEIRICEGYATGATIFECLNIPTAVVFDAGNIFEATKAIKEKYPDANIIICADNDAANSINTGIEKALKAATSLKTKLTFPVFNGNTGSDYNDLFVSEGAEAVKQHLIPKELSDAALLLSKTLNQEIETPAHADNEQIGASIFHNNGDGLFFFDRKKQDFVRIASSVEVTHLTQELEEENA